MTENEAVTWLVDEAYKASREMIRTHHKEDIIRFIVLAQTLELHGYTVIWVKGRRVIGATRKQEVVPIADNTTMPKEVVHAVKRSNAGTH
jgi:hypothetical protein